MMGIAMMELVYAEKTNDVYCIGGIITDIVHSLCIDIQSIS